MGKTNSADYFGLSYVASLILAIIPVTSLICGAVTRFKEGKILAGILRIVLGWNIIYVLDLIYMVVNKRIFRLINV